METTTIYLSPESESLRALIFDLVIMDGCSVTISNMDDIYKLEITGQNAREWEGWTPPGELGSVEHYEGEEYPTMSLAQSRTESDLDSGYRD